MSNISKDSTTYQLAFQATRDAISPYASTAASGSNTTIVDVNPNLASSAASALLTAGILVNIVSRATNQEYVTTISAISDATFTIGALPNSYSVVAGDTFRIVLI